ncbi:MAG: non-canonical purine NTP pyrophosphatase, partial [Bdellovibrionota bacterium]
MKEIWIATKNRGKMIEFETLLKAPDVTLHSVVELNTYTAPPETGATFEDNARIKAKSLKAMKPGCWILADDSGLEVPGINNMPGVHSARYAGPKASDPENVAKLLKMIGLRSADKRQAQFKCVIVGYKPTGEEFVVTGEVKGEISRIVKGKDGFGYDPVFIPD